MFGRSRLCVCGMAIEGMSIRALVSSCLAQGISQTPCCMLFVVGAIRAAARLLLFPFHLWIWLFVGFVVFHALCAPVFQLVFLGLLKSTRFWPHRRVALLTEGCPRWALACNSAEDVLRCLFLHILQLATEWEECLEIDLEVDCFSCYYIAFC